MNAVIDRYWVMRKLHHQEITRPSTAELAGQPRSSITVVVDNVRSLYNVGSIFRSCDGARVDHLYLCGFTPHPPRTEIDKTALGATESVPWTYCPSILDALTTLRRGGYRIAALEHTDASISCFDLTPDRFPLAVIVGNEITGVSADALDHCDFAIEIPMLGIKQSLNVAVATGIIIYQCLRTLTASTSIHQPPNVE